MARRSPTAASSGRGLRRAFLPCTVPRKLRQPSSPQISPWFRLTTALQREETPDVESFGRLRTPPSIIGRIESVTPLLAVQISLPECPDPHRAFVPVVPRRRLKPCPHDAPTQWPLCQLCCCPRFLTSCYCNIGFGDRLSGNWRAKTFRFHMREFYETASPRTTTGSTTAVQGSGPTM